MLDLRIQGADPEELVAKANQALGAVRDLARSSGWALLTELIDAEIDHLRTNLEHSSDHDEEYRGSIRALRSVREWAKHSSKTCEDTLANNRGKA